MLKCVYIFWAPLYMLKVICIWKTDAPSWLTRKVGREGCETKIDPYKSTALSIIHTYLLDYCDSAVNPVKTEVLLENIRIQLILHKKHIMSLLQRSAS
jgi:hypothetical protein